MAANADDVFDAIGSASSDSGSSSSSDSSSNSEIGPDHCPRCKQLVEGPAIQACGKKFHPEHFTCEFCDQPFPNGEFFEHEGLPYCATDYHEQFGSRCKGCGELITGRCITAMNAKWHADHFVCCECGKSLAGGSFIEFEEEAHCKPCAREKKRKRKRPDGVVCARCKEVIDGEFIVLQGQKMHPHHFSCAKCKCSFKGNNCHEYEGRLYCEPHYRELLASTCAQCRKPITGRSITALGKQWHPEHFVCAHCEVPFAGANYMIKEGRAYCEAHYTQLFGKVCHWCRKNISGSGIQAGGAQYHTEHFLCVLCDDPLGNKYVLWEGKTCCKKCYGQLPRKIKEREAKIAKADKKREKAAAKAAARGD